MKNVRRVKAPAGREPAQFEDVNGGASAVAGLRRGQGERVGCGSCRPTSLQADAAAPLLLGAQRAQAGWLLPVLRRTRRAA